MPAFASSTFSIVRNFLHSAHFFLSRTLAFHVQFDGAPYPAHDILDDDNSALFGSLLVLGPIYSAVVISFWPVHQCLESWDYKYFRTLVRPHHDVPWLRH